MTRICPASKLDCRNACATGEACILWPSIPPAKPSGLVPDGDEWQELMLLRQLYWRLDADAGIASVVAYHVGQLLHPRS